MQPNLGWDHYVLLALCAITTIWFVLKFGKLLEIFWKAIRTSFRGKDDRKRTET